MDGNVRWLYSTAGSKCVLYRDCHCCCCCCCCCFLASFFLFLVLFVVVLFFLLIGGNGHVLYRDCCSLHHQLFYSLFSYLSLSLYLSLFLSLSLSLSLSLCFTLPRTETQAEKCDVTKQTSVTERRVFKGLKCSRALLNPRSFVDVYKSIKNEREAAGSHQAYTWQDLC